MKDVDASHGAFREAQRLDLRYCERCGVLGVAPAGQPAQMCPACACALRWIYGEDEGGVR